MLPRRPRLRVNPELNAMVARPPSSFTPITPPEDSLYPHVTISRSLHLEIQVHSPSIKVVRSEGQQLPSALPIFGDHDRICGHVVLDPSCSHSGHLSISMVGTFVYASPNGEVEEGPSHIPSSAASGPQKHIFFTASNVFSVSPGSEVTTPRSAFRDAFAVRRRPSASSLSGTAQSQRTFPFSFSIPRGLRAGEELPASFSSSTLVQSGSRGRSFAECIEVKYAIVATWEASDGEENQANLSAPIFYQPDSDFQSLDALSKEPDSWLEMPLKSDRQIQFHCAVTLPSPSVFTRNNTIPYFVIFTTNPRSLPLTREIASDATVSVSLLRQVTITVPMMMLPTPPQTPSSSGEESEGLSLAIRPSRRLLKRVVKSAPPILTRVSHAHSETRIDELPDQVKNKPLPLLPSEPTAISELRTLQTNVCIGFPKRPRQRCDPQSHPSLESHTALPDGLYKGRVQLNKNMLPTIDWPGVSVKYYLDVSVVFGQDDLRARIPLRVV